MLVKVAGKDTETVINALIKNARRLSKQLYRSLTPDRGKQMAAHRRFTLARHPSNGVKAEASFMNIIGIMRNSVLGVMRPLVGTGSCSVAVYRG